MSLLLKLIKSLLALFVASTFAGYLSHGFDFGPQLQQLSLADVPVAAYAPPAVSSPDHPVEVLVVLHGMNGNGPAIGKGLLHFAIDHRLALLAPTFNYNSNWKDPNVVTTEDPALSAKINQIVAEFEAKNPSLHFNQRLLLYGFSRGAQLAHRYALLYPQDTLGVAALSAGSYTLPETIYQGKPLPFPFGVSDLQKYTGQPFDAKDFAKVHFCLEVGAQDNNPAATPPAWNNYLGQSRLDRSASFYKELLKDGVPVQRTVFAGTGHQETAAMREAAIKYLQGLV